MLLPREYIFKTPGFVNNYILWLIKIALMLAAGVSMFLVLESSRYLATFNLGRIRGLEVRIDLVLDIERTLFFSALGRVICAVFTYRGSYIRREKYFNRFLGILFIFAISIIVLIFGGRLFSLMVG